jgi:hypothetical protein
MLGVVEDHVDGVFGLTDNLSYRGSVFRAACGGDDVLARLHGVLAGCAGGRQVEAGLLNGGEEISKEWRRGVVLGVRSLKGALFSHFLSFLDMVFTGLVVLVIQITRLSFVEEFQFRGDQIGTLILFEIIFTKSNLVLVELIFHRRR